MCHENKLFAVIIFYEKKVVTEQEEDKIDFMGVRYNTKSHRRFFYTFVAKNGSHDFMTHHFHSNGFYTLFKAKSYMLEAHHDFI